MMRPIRTGGALAGPLMIFTALAACGGPPVTAPAAPPSLTAAAGQPASGAVDESALDSASAGGVAATRQTCDLFRQMIDGMDTLSTREQQQLVDRMADAVQYTGNPDLMRAVLDMGQGWLNSNPQQFATGMRALSKICHVPYE
jgi:hypothetical protein